MPSAAKFKIFLYYKDSKYFALISVAGELRPAAVVHVRRRSLLLYHGNQVRILLAPRAAGSRAEEAANPDRHPQPVSVGGSG